VSVQASAGLHSYGSRRGITLLALISLRWRPWVSRSRLALTTFVGAAYRNGVLMEQSNLIESLPYDSLANGTTTVTVTTKAYPIRERLIVAQYYQNTCFAQKSVTLISRRQILCTTRHDEVHEVERSDQILHSSTTESMTLKSGARSVDRRAAH